MIDISRKKFDGEMKLQRTRAHTHSTIKELRDELKLVKNIADYWEEKSNRRAFGEIQNENISLKNGEKYIPNMDGLRFQNTDCFYNT